MDWLKDLDTNKVILWVAPGAFIALFRSYFLKGSFPTIGKDDIAALIVGSVIYRYAVLGFVTQEQLAKLSDHGWIWLLFIGLAPCLLGFVLGIFEASDLTGRAMRWCGFAMPTPTPSAWDTLFRKLPVDSIALFILDDGTIVPGKWTGDGLNSSASSDPGNLDIYLGELGKLDKNERYTPYSPKRGVYISSGKIRTIEIIVPETSTNQRSGKWLKDLVEFFMIRGNLQKSMAPMCRQVSVSQTKNPSTLGEAPQQLQKRKSLPSRNPSLPIRRQPSGRNSADPHSPSIP